MRIEQNPYVLTIKQALNINTMVENRKVRFVFTSVIDNFPRVTRRSSPLLGLSHRCSARHASKL